MKKLLSICLFISLFVEVIHSQKVDDLNLSAMIQPADSSQFVRDSEYFNWCNSVIKDEEGIYHLFYSRWPRKLSFFAWLTHSEIAHATSQKMEGPYLYKETVLKARPGFWDSVTAHNVQVNKLGDSYYMYYTSTNTGNSQLTEKQLQETASSQLEFITFESTGRSGDSFFTEWPMGKIGSSFIGTSSPYLYGGCESVCLPREGWTILFNYQRR